MNLRTVWRRTSTQTHGQATATQENYALTTHWYIISFKKRYNFIYFAMYDSLNEKWKEGSSADMHILLPFFFSFNTNS